jgi:hypothetical protein
VRLNHQDVDSHTAILTRAKVAPEKQDGWSFYEYNPLTKVLGVDRAVDGHDIEAARNWVEARDWKAIVEPLVVKPIINPFAKRAPKITQEHIKALKQWASVGASVRASVWDSVGASVRASVWDSVGASVWASVGASVGDSVWASVGASVWDSVWASVGASVGASVWDSVWDSVRGYISSFFAIKYAHDFSSVVRLWEAGLVSSYDGKTWRLHGGKDAKALYEWTPRSRKKEVHDEGK